MEITILKIFEEEIKNFFEFLNNNDISLLPDKIIMGGKEITDEEFRNMFDEYIIQALKN